MKNIFKLFCLGVLTAISQAVCVGQQIDVHNPAGQGLYRIQAPYMSTFGQQLATNPDSYHAAVMIFGGTNLPNGLLTNGSSGAFLTNSTFNGTFSGTNINDGLDLS